MPEQDHISEGRKQSERKVLSKIVLGTFLIVFAIFLINLRYGKFLLTNDTYSPELNPIQFIERSIASPAWRSYRGLGSPSDSEQADLFRAGIYAVLDIFLPEWLLSQFYAFLALFAGVAGTGLLGYKYAQYHKYRGNQYFVFVASAAVYATLLWANWVFNYPIFPYISLYAFFPWVLLAILNYIYKPSYLSALFLLVAQLLFCAAGAIATLFFVSFGAFVLFAFTLVFSLKLQSWSKLLLPINALLILIVCNLFWLLPFGYYVKNFSSDVIGSSVNRVLTDSFIASQERYMTASNSIRFYTNSLELKSSTEGSETIFKYGERYLESELYIVLSYLPIALSLLGLLILAIRKHPIPWVFYLFVLLGWFGIKNVNPPLGELFQFAQEYIPLFKQVFRWPFSKFGEVLALGISVAVGFAVAEICGLFSHIKVSRFSSKAVSYLMLSILLGAQLLYANYLFTPNFYSEIDFATIPESYKELQHYLEGDTDSRILLLPPPSYLYAREYDYGYFGSGFLHYMIPNPILDRANSVGSERNDLFYEELIALYQSRQFESLEHLLGVQGVEYILVDRQLIGGRYGLEMDWELLDECLETYDLVWNVGGLELYSLSSSHDEGGETDLYQPFVAPHSGILGRGHTYNRVDSATGALFPALTQLSKPYIGTGFVGGTVNNIEISNWNYVVNEGEYPSDSLLARFDSASKELLLSPNLPLVEGVTYKTDGYKARISDSFYALGFGENLLFRSDIYNRYAAVAADFRNINRVSVYSNRDADTIDLLSLVNENSGLDCDGGTKIPESVVKSQRVVRINASGEDTPTCVNTAVDVEDDSAAKLDISWMGSEGSVLSVCLYSVGKTECLGKKRYFYTEEKVVNKQEMKFDSVVGGSDSITLNISLKGYGGDESHIDIETLDLTLIRKSGTVSPKPSENSVEIQGATEGDGKTFISLPVIHGASHQFSAEDGEVLEFQTVPNDSDEMVQHEYSYELNDSAFVQSVLNGSVYNNFDLLKGASSGEYLYLVHSQNLDGVPATLCIYPGGVDRCVANIYWSDDDIAQLGYFSWGDAGKSMVAGISMQAARKPSSNSISELFVMRVPEEWLRFKLVLGGADLADSSTMAISDQEILGVNVIYSSPALSDDERLFALNESVAKGWQAYLVDESSRIADLPAAVKMFALALVGNQVDESNEVVVDGWRQGWLISDDLVDSRNGYRVEAFYMPNVYGYVGYLVLAVFVGWMVVGVVWERYGSRIKRD